MKQMRRGPGYLVSKGWAILLLIAGRHQRAHEAFSKMLDRLPADAYALRSRAHVAAQLGRRAEAIADLERLLGIDRIAVERQALRTRSEAADWFNLGFLRDEAGDCTGAEAAFRCALGIDPKLDRAWYGLGLVLIRMHRLDEAVTALKRNTELQPMSPYGWYQLARVQMDRRQPEEARRIIRHLKGFEPKVAAQLEREVGSG